MWNPTTMESMTGFWPPKANRAWSILLEPLRRHYLHNHFGISKVEVDLPTDWNRNIGPNAPALRNRSDIPKRSSTVNAAGGLSPRADGFRWKIHHIPI